MKSSDFIVEAEAWQTKKGKNKNGGLNKKGVASYRRSHPGSKLQTAVTTKPSKLKKGSKASKRRKSFCARMKGMKKSRTGAKTKRDPNSRINKALRKWHCESVQDLMVMLENAMTWYNQVLTEAKDQIDEQGVAEDIPAQAGVVDPKIQFLQPTIQFAEKHGYKVTMGEYLQSWLINKLNILFV
jgi:uncharacterized protein YcgL (UPF0745 family)